MNSICDDRIGWHEVDPEPVQPRKECGWTEQERSVLNPDMAYDKIRLEWPNGLKYGFAEESLDQIEARKHRADLQRLRGFRPIDDDFMRCMFRDNTPLVEFVLRILLGNDQLELISCETQVDLKRVTGARSVVLDALAKDKDKKLYNIEIQRGDLGSDPHRARYHSSALDIESLDHGQSFCELPDTYVIFITEKDFFGRKEPLYLIRNMNITTGEPFGDGAHILYVNGEYRGDDPIGRLMHDFNCSEAEDMQYPLMAEKVKYLKDSPKGVAEMCKVIEEMRKQEREEGRAEGRAEGRVEGRVEGRAEGRAEGAIESLVETVQHIMKRLNVKLDEAIELAAVPEKYVSAVKEKVLA